VLETLRILIPFDHERPNSACLLIYGRDKKSCLGSIMPHQRWSGQAESPYFGTHTYAHTVTKFCVVMKLGERKVLTVHDAPVIEDEVLGGGGNLWWECWCKLAILLKNVSEPFQLMHLALNMWRSFYTAVLKQWAVVCNSILQETMHRLSCLHDEGLLQRFCLDIHMCRLMETVMPRGRDLKRQ